MKPRRLALAAAAAIALAATACGGAETPAPATDEAYLAVLCAGLERYAEAVETATDADGIAPAVSALLEALRAVGPPLDADEFHEDFLAYLEAAVDDPTRPLAVAPPLPAEGARARLAGRERAVPECREPTFLSRAGER